MRTITIALLMFGAIICNGSALAGCYSDFDCGFGNKCIKATGDINITGICVRPGDEFGNPKPNYSAPQPQPQKVRGCTFDTDCGIGFSCIKRDGQIHGICVK